LREVRVKGKGTRGAVLYKITKEKNKYSI